MNITDVDDKIILAARRQHFLQQYTLQNPELTENVLDTVRQAFDKYIASSLPLLEATTAESYATESRTRYGHVMDGQPLAKDESKPGDSEAKIKMHLNTASSAAAALTRKADTNSADFYESTSGVLLPYLDTLHKHEIDPSDHSIFKALAKHYENRFFEDMQSLNVLKPDNVTRVTEYGPQIVDYVRTIQDNGFAYENDHSVYYDTRAWEASGGIYARLEPWNKNDTALQADGEGSLSKPSGTFEKPPSDFALWKASKPGEPGWDSPWGSGRPGWHIECSCMASDILGNQFDIHSGGIDLAFPHHDNELAQSEAYYKKSGHESKQWVNYFIHMGHLSIQGSKMSKSLKNFTTIREALSRGEWTSRSLRVAFLLGAWREGFEITDDVITSGRVWEERLDNVFLKALDVERDSQTSQTGSDGSEDALLKERLSAAQTAFDRALCDSFNTPEAMKAVSDLITSYNSAQEPSNDMTIAIAKWLSHVVDIFGLDSTPDTSHIGWSGIDISDVAKPYVYAMSSVRDEIRRQESEIRSLGTGKQISDPIAQSKVDTELVSTVPTDESAKPYQAAWSQFAKELDNLVTSSAPAKQYLTLCDKLRDEILWNLNIHLEDRKALQDGTPRPAMVRPLNATLRKERADKEQLAAAKREKQLELRLKAEQDEATKREKAKQSHLDMFCTAEFSAWDEEGMPLKDAEGKEVAKSRTKKLRKDWERQKKLHETFLAESK